MSGHPHIVAMSWVVNALTGDDALRLAAPGGVHDDLAPGGTAYPLVRCRQAGLRNVSVVNGVVAMVAVTIDVTVAGQGRSYTPLAAAAARVHAALHRQDGAGLGGAVLSCVELLPLAYPELADGVSYRHLGGSYELLVQVA